MLFNIIFVLVTLFILGKIWDRHLDSKEKKQLQDPEYLLETSSKKLKQIRIELESEETKYRELASELKSKTESTSIYSHLLDELGEFERTFISLQEKYRHNKKVLLECINDSINFAEYNHDVVHEYALLDCDLEPGAYERFEEAVKEPNLKLEQIKKRFENLLSNPN